jgi:acyl-CoA reductase-like NAD-dependent aldehyde dehydrogenase
MGLLEHVTGADGRRAIRVRNPVDNSETGVYPVFTADEVHAVVARAHEVQAAWALVPVRQRAARMIQAVEVLRKNADAWAEILRAETGRVAIDTLMIELFASLDAMNHFARRAEAQLADRGVGLHLLKAKRARVTYVPRGVVGVISPWNGPFILSINPTIQAVLGGNAVVIKPSEYTPGAGMLVERLFREAGFPEGLVQVVTGDGETGAALLEADLQQVCFTGSVRTGRKVGETCGRRLIPCTLELGGKDPLIVFADADLERAAGAAVFGGMINAGQFCSAVERVFVERSAYPAFLEKLTAKVAALQLGRDIGPFIARPQQDIVARHVDEAIAAGARLHVGGKPEGGSYLPTVLSDVPLGCSLMTEETFGPVIPVVPFDTEAEAIAMANAGEFGLGGAVFGRDLTRCRRVARQLVVGGVTINDVALIYGALELPFGGRKSSGVGQVHGEDALRRFVHAMPVLEDRFGSKEEAVWFPYTDDKIARLRKALDVLWGTPLKWLLS